jgi:hypothetical protein
LIILGVLLAALLVATVGCGGQGVSLDSSASATATAVPGDTDTTGIDAAAAADIKAVSDYASALTRWAHQFSADFDGEGDKALHFNDLNQPTDSELLRARQFIELVRKSVAQLKTINAPAQVAKAQAEFYSSLRDELDALERYVNAVDWGSARDAQLASREAEKANAQRAQAVKALAPYVDLSGVIQS